MELKFEKNLFVRKGKIGTQYILINGRQCFEINDIGEYIWECFAIPSSINSIIEKIKEEFEIKNEQKTLNDVNKFIDILKKYNLIEEVL